MSCGKRVTVEWTCKRCGRMVVTEPSDDVVCGDVFLPSLPKGWEYVGSHLLCAECSLLFDRVLDSFLRGRLP